MATQAVVSDRHEQMAVKELEARRAALRERIDSLPPNAHRRIELQAELKALTSSAIRLETRQSREGAGDLF